MNVLLGKGIQNFLLAFKNLCEYTEQKKLDVEHGIYKYIPII